MAANLPGPSRSWAAFSPAFYHVQRFFQLEDADARILARTLRSLVGYCQYGNLPCYVLDAARQVSLTGNGEYDCRLMLPYGLPGLFAAVGRDNRCRQPVDLAHDLPSGLFLETAREKHENPVGIQSLAAWDLTTRLWTLIKEFPTLSLLILSLPPSQSFSEGGRAGTSPSHIGQKGFLEFEHEDGLQIATSNEDKRRTLPDPSDSNGTYRPANCSTAASQIPARIDKAIRNRSMAAASMRNVRRARLPQVRPGPSHPANLSIHPPVSCLLALARAFPSVSAMVTPEDRFLT